jgi:hypothetical protein
VTEPRVGVPVEALRALLRQLHSTASQEAAAARVALAIWRRAAARGDRAVAAQAADEAAARLEALFDALAAVEAEGKRIVADAEGSGVSPDPAPRGDL